MIRLHVEYITKPGMRDAYLNIINELGIGEASRADKGCRKYEYSFDEGREDVLLLDEEWEDDECLKLHFEMPHLAKLQELKDEFLLDTKIEREDL